MICDPVSSGGSSSETVGVGTGLGLGLVRFTGFSVFAPVVRFLLFETRASTGSGFGFNCKILIQNCV